jgi:hypothetical protein
MKNSIVVTLAMLLISGAVSAQEKAIPQKPDNATVATKPLTVSGQVSSDRKTLVTDIDSEWSVSNPDTLKGHEGQRVTVKCYVDTDKSSLQVLSVKREAGESRYSARYTDSAFRR